MLTIAFLLISAAAAQKPFNVTDFIVPRFVPKDVKSIELECKYDANFTLLNWFKGRVEFFRYKPRTVPSIRTFPNEGIGQIDVVYCGPVACKIRLSELNSEATGLYRCDIERDSPPYRYATREAFMQVEGVEPRKPKLEGLADDIGPGDDIYAYCRGSPDVQIHWYMNAKEVENMKGSKVFKLKNDRSHYIGNPPTLVLECGEISNNRLIMSNQEIAHFKDNKPDVIQNDQTDSNRSHVGRCCNVIIIGFCFLLFVLNHK